MPIPPAAAPSFPRRILWPLLMIVTAATAARAWLQFHSPLAPGMNGAYYFVQARAVLEHGGLGIPDLPLTFWLQAGIAWLLQHVGGMAPAPAIVAAVKFADSFLPTLAALPIAWLGWRWQRAAARPSVMAALAPAAMVCLGAQALGMTGDFQKNSLALVWLAALAPAAHAFLRQPSFRSALLPLGLLALLGLTHVGVLGAALVFTAVLTASALFSAPPADRRKILRVAFAGVGVLTAAGAITFFAFDPARMIRLGKAVVTPSSFLTEQGPGGPPGDGHAPPPGFGAMDDEPDSPSATTMPDRGPDGFGRLDGGMPGPPGRQGLLGRLPGALFVVLGIAGLGLAWWRRRSLPVADFSLAIAAALTTATLGGPFFDQQKSERLMLIAAIPAAMTLSFLLAGITRAWVRRLGGGLVLGATVASAALYLPHGGRSTISEETFAELQALAQYTGPADHSLIVARHGLEWWAAWALHTHIAQPQAVSAEDWTHFKKVFYLSEKHAEGPDDARAPFGANRPTDAQSMAPPDGDNTTFHAGPAGFGGPMERDFSAQFPSDAVTLHDGPQLKLLLLPSALSGGLGQRDDFRAIRK